MVDQNKLIELIKFTNTLKLFFIEENCKGKLSVKNSKDGVIFTIEL